MGHAQRDLPLLLVHYQNEILDRQHSVIDLYGDHHHSVNKRIPVLNGFRNESAYFDVIVGSGAEGMLKPDPRLYEIALERLEVEPEEAIFVDDFIENVEGANQFGIHGIHFKTPGQAIGEIQELLADQ